MSSLTRRDLLRAAAGVGGAITELAAVVQAPGPGGAITLQAEHVVAAADQRTQASERVDGRPVSVTMRTVRTSRRSARAGRDRCHRC